VLQESPRLMPLSLEERRAKQRMLLRDTSALGTLSALIVVLSFVTYLLFHSFTSHRQMLENRWRQRGEAAMSAGKPDVALNDLHAALAYAPDNRGLQIELAMALAAVGKTQEAQTYFNTLLEAEPGNGMINLQLARLAIRQGNAQAAVDNYQAAIDGTWNGDAFTRRRDIRLELAKFLIAQRRFPEARSLLLIASGNGPDNPALQLIIGGMLEQADDPADAIDVYHKAAQGRGTNGATRLPAFEGQAHAAMTLGRFAQARTWLNAAIADQAFAHQDEFTHNTVHAELETANSEMALAPMPSLPAAERAHRIARVAQIAQGRLLACQAAPLAGSSPEATAASPAAQLRQKLFGQLGANLARLNPLAPPPVPAAPVQAAPAQTQPPADLIGTLSMRWVNLPSGTPLEQRLLADPEFAQNTLQLAYETERVAAVHCTAAAGDDALLLRLAETADGGETQP